MPRKLPPTGTDKDLNLSSMIPLFANESAAREFIEKQRWPDGPFCPHCGIDKPYALKAKEGSKRPVRPGVYKCSACRKQFTVRIGTIFEDSKVPLCKWLMAIHLMTSSKKGVSSHQIARECGITQKSAWFLNHRIREAMKKEPLAGMLQGVVEVDESYIGGKPRKPPVPLEKPKLGPQDSQFRGRRSPHSGRGTKKASVLVLVQRDGSARCMPLPQVSSKTLGEQIEVHLAKDALLVTDELNLYLAAGRKHPGGHEVIKHGAQEYSRIRPDGLHIHTNTAESFFALLKRGHYGIFHKMSKKHPHRYCTEFAFRWNQRNVSDGERMTAAIKGAEGKRLTYKPLAASS